MKDKEWKTVKRVVDEMKQAHGIIVYWLKGSPIEKTLASWIDDLEKVLRSDQLEDIEEQTQNAQKKA